ncbi:MAG: SET domain-containing protein-lysine N-methyltransferase [Candidatus Roizmanbacteria bacterium]
MILLPETSYEVKITEKKGKGVFAKKEIPAGTIIADYLGKIIHPEEESTESNNLHYGLYISDTTVICPDFTSNGAHNFNHSCTPNSTFFPYKGHTLIVSTRTIFIGEEFNIKYLIYPSEHFSEEVDMICHCKSPLCRGTQYCTDQEWDNYDAIEDKAYVDIEPSLVFGTYLQPLDIYPETIADLPSYMQIFGYHEKEPLKYSKLVMDKEEIRNLMRESGQNIYIESIDAVLAGITPTTYYFLYSNLH